MDIHSVSISKKDIDLVAAEASPAIAGGMTVGDACTVYKQARPILMVAISILSVLYPQGAAALTATIAVLDAACKEKEA